MGKGKIRNFISFIEARWQKERKDLIYRVYLTDYIMALAGGEGKRYYDIVYGKVDDRTAEEIIIQTIDKAGLVIG